ncbi:AzlC family ABC transporter permease [Actinoplanes sp. NPDC049668]|uniref:AzlC family ABC transporter permease n=1 Tax=unclassified Actinoplanes TaxID=2626549 RepID=UPI0033AA186B
MRTPSRTPDRALLRDAAAIAAAMVAVGASFGAIAIAYGMPAWVPFLMSTAVFAGGAQFLAVGLIAAGNPLAAVAAGLLLNARHLPFGLAVSATVGPRWRDRLIGSHLMTDEVVAFTLAEEDPARRRRTYWLIGATLFTSWNLGTALGVWLGGAAGDPAALGLDAAFPAGLIALILPSLRDRDTRVAALAGAAVAVALTPVLPAGLPVLCALLGLGAVFLPRRRAARAGAGHAEPGAERTAAVPGQAIKAGPSAESAVGQGGGAADRAAGRRVETEEAPC